MIDSIELGMAILRCMYLDTQALFEMAAVFFSHIWRFGENGKESHCDRESIGNLGRAFKDLFIVAKQVMDRAASKQELACFLHVRLGQID